MQKINNNGEYLPFPGVTTLCKLSQFPEYQLIEEKLRSCKELCKYFSPLPASSYHMTLCDISCGDVGEILVNNFERFCELFRELRADPFCHYPQVEVKQLYTQSAMGVILAPDEYTQYLRVLVSDILGLDVRPYLFHMTFGYMYRKNLSDKAKKELKETSIFISSLLSEVGVQLQPPQFCFFRDMTAFHPVK